MCEWTRGLKRCMLTKRIHWRRQRCLKIAQIENRLKEEQQAYDEAAEGIIKLRVRVCVAREAEQCRSVCLAGRVAHHSACCYAAVTCDTGITACCALYKARAAGSR